MPNSTAADRLHEAQRTYRAAYNNRIADYRDAKTSAQVKAIQRNLDAAEGAYLDAGLAILENNGAAVERAYKAACDANDAIEEARQNAEDLANRIRAVATAVSKVSDLIAAAKKRP